MGDKTMKKRNVIKRFALVLLTAALILSTFAGSALAVGYVEATGGRVNVRSGPGTGYKSLYTLVKGEKVEYLGSSTDNKGATWYKIQYYSYGTGWVHSQYAKYTSLFDYVEAYGGDVNVRTSPSLYASDLGTLKEGQMAAYLNQDSTDDRGVEWYKVSFNGSIGWVSSRYSRLVNSSAEEFDPDYGDVKITGNSVNVRKTPSLNGKDMGTVTKDAYLDYLGKTSVDDRGVTWYQVEFKGQNGWVSSRYGEVVKSSSVTLPDFSFLTSYVEADGGDCNIRNAPELSGKALGTMKKGATATYLDDYSTDTRGWTWYKVNYNGIVGWVSSRYATLY